MVALRLLLTAAAVAAASTAVAAPIDVYTNPNVHEGKIPVLKVGDPAPPLVVAEWIQGGPAAHFDKGTVYLVEFWATWCGPCRKSLPHLSRLQERYGQRGVRVIGVAAAEESGPEDLRAFVAGRDSEIVFDVAYVTDESVYAHWMWAARASGLPWLFIVDRDGRIAWWGQHFYADFEKIVDAVVRGKPIPANRHAGPGDLALWNRAEKGWGLVKARKFAGAEVEFGAVVAADPGRFWYESVERFRLLLVELRRDSEAYDWAREIVRGIVRDNPHALAVIGDVAATVVPPGRRNLDVAAEAISRAKMLTQGRDAEVIAAEADLLEARGELQSARQRREEALSIADARLRVELQRRFQERNAADPAPR